MGPNSEQTSNVANVAIKALDDAPKLTKRQIGELRNKFFTKRQGTVVVCGHKIGANDEPNTNCKDCWEAYFRTHTGVVKGIEAIIATFGEVELVKARGSKFVKRYKQYAALVDQEQRNAATEAAQEN